MRARPVPFCRHQLSTASRWTSAATSWSLWVPARDAPRRTATTVEMDQVLLVGVAEHRLRQLDRRLHRPGCARFLTLHLHGLLR